MGIQLSLAPHECEKIQVWADSFSKNPDVQKALHGNLAAGRRVRKQILEVTKLAIPARKEILVISKKRKASRS